MTQPAQYSIEQNRESLLALRTKRLIHRHVDSYRSLELAQAAAGDQSTKPRWIVLGDNGWYWVVAPFDAERLISSGHELAS